MKYVCLRYDEETRIEGMPKIEWDAIVREVHAYNEEPRKQEHLITAETLRSVQMATTVRVRNGKLPTTDGPFAETQEQLGGFFLINARNLSEAIQVTSRLPGGRLGWHRSAADHGAEPGGVEYEKNHCGAANVGGRLHGSPEPEIDDPAQAPNEQFDRYCTEMLKSIDALLLGRVTYQLFAGSWLSATGPDADRLNELPETVSPRTLDGVAWKNPRLVREKVAEEVEGLKR